MRGKAARFVAGQYRKQTNVAQLLKNLQWRSLQERHFGSRQTLFYKTANGQAAYDIPRFFPPQTPAPEWVTTPNSPSPSTFRPIQNSFTREWPGFETSSPKQFPQCWNLQTETPAVDNIQRHVHGTTTGPGQQTTPGQYRLHVCIWPSVLNPSTSPVHRHAAFPF